MTRRGRRSAVPAVQAALRFFGGYLAVMGVLTIVAAVLATLFVDWRVIFIAIPAGIAALVGVGMWRLADRRERTGRG